MGRVEHDKILSLIGYCYDENTRLIQHIVMEKMDEDLLKFLEKHQPKKNQTGDLTQLDLLAMFIDVASACFYLEERKLVHRDIAARNCLIKDVSSDGEIRRIVKIGDFGLTRDMQSKDYYRLAREKPIPIRWMSPESIEGIYSSKSDVWSFG